MVKTHLFAENGEHAHDVERSITIALHLRLHQK